jgi:hypothetical protein
MIMCPRCGTVSYHPRDVVERYCGRCHQFHDFFRDEDDLVLSGFYVRGEDGRLRKSLVPPGREPDLHICRRVADFTGGVLPAGAVGDRCTRCGVDVGRQPVKRGPIVCMQCARIEPLPQQES